MTSLISIIAIFSLSSLAHADVIFRGVPIESHLYSIPLSAERLSKLGVKDPDQAAAIFKSSNSCGIEVTIYKVNEVYRGDTTETIRHITSMGEWCAPQIELLKPQIFHLQSGDFLGSSLSYDYINDEKNGIVIPGWDGMAIGDLQFSGNMVKLDTPYYSHEKTPHREATWQDKVDAGYLVEKSGKYYITSGVPISKLAK